MSDVNVAVSNGSDSQLCKAAADSESGISVRHAERMNAKEKNMIIFGIKTFSFGGMELFWKFSFCVFVEIELSEDRTNKLTILTYI